MPRHRDKESLATGVSSSAAVPPRGRAVEVFVIVLVFGVPGGAPRLRPTPQWQVLEVACPHAPLLVAVS